MKHPSIQTVNIQKIKAGKIQEMDDSVAVEEPLEIKLAYQTETGDTEQNIAVTMRTPGQDKELAAGFLFTEEIIKNKTDIKEIIQTSNKLNQVLVRLNDEVKPKLANINRNFYSNSSCGICGKASIDAIRTSISFNKPVEPFYIKASVFYPLQDVIKKHQQLFEDTGGIHASALFDFNGRFIMLREDIGRHNALDKIIGVSFLQQQLPLNNCILLLSGRASFELVQKAAMAGIVIIAAVGAPSSLAIEMANESGITLIGFLRNDRLNIYSGKERIIMN